mmetsp:Transcript_11360/g.27397  ORF Transcript_11360/g.27397 Transcript_11360/m.27397 type:complete len:240 (-) Transcript_11360:1393-2112(-)
MELRLQILYGARPQEQHACRPTSPPVPGRFRLHRLGRWSYHEQDLPCRSTQFGSSEQMGGVGSELLRPPPQPQQASYGINPPVPIRFRWHLCAGRSSYHAQSLPCRLSLQLDGKSTHVSPNSMDVVVVVVVVVATVVATVVVVVGAVAVAVVVVVVGVLLFCPPPHQQHASFAVKPVIGFAYNEANQQSFFGNSGSYQLHGSLPESSQPGISMQLPSCTVVVVVVSVGEVWTSPLMLPM